MKNYEKMTHDVFQRIEAYKVTQKKKRQRLIRVAASVSCVCLVALVSFGVWRSGIPANLPAETTQASSYPGVNATSGETKGEPTVRPAANNKIVIHPMDPVFSDRSFYSLNVADFVDMSWEELNDYYGVNVFPALPDDLKEWPEEGGHPGVYRRNGGTGEVYYDSNVLNYSDETLARSVNVEVSKDPVLLGYNVFLDGSDEKSVINNVEVTIGQTQDNKYYYAEFIYQNVGFQVITTGLTQDELVSVISSLIQ